MQGFCKPQSSAQARKKARFLLLGRIKVIHKTVNFGDVRSNRTLAANFRKFEKRLLTR